MKSLRRHVTSHATFFITVVSYRRRPILLNRPEFFHSSWSGVELDAWVVLPDHFHALIRVGERPISEIVHGFKMAFWRRYRGVYGPGRVWHNRFWDHVIRNQEDLNRHVDYIHYNPVRHGMVSRPFLYEFSSARNWLSRGYYQEDWGTAENPVKNGEFGE